MKEQQIQRYEMTRYAAASLARLQEVARALEVTIDSHERMDQRETAHRSVWRKPLVLMMLD